MPRTYDSKGFADGGHSLSMGLEGMDDLISTFERLSRKYPDRTDELLRQDGRDLRKDIVKNAKEMTNVDTKTKLSLGKAGSYSVSQVKGWGSNKYVEITARSPHFHLVENGHNVVIGKKKSKKKQGDQIKRGKRHASRSKSGLKWVEGKHFLREAVKGYENNVERHVSNMVDELLKEEGLI